MYSPSGVMLFRMIIMFTIQTWRCFLFVVGSCCTKITSLKQRLCGFNVQGFILKVNQCPKYDGPLYNQTWTQQSFFSHSLLGLPHKLCQGKGKRLCSQGNLYCSTSYSLFTLLAISFSLVYYILSHPCLTHHLESQQNVHCCLQVETCFLLHDRHMLEVEFCVFPHGHTQGV